MRDVIVAITAASFSGNKGAAAMLRSSIAALHARYGERLQINLMSVYPRSDRLQAKDDHIRIISQKPEQLLFIAFPLAVLYFLFRWLPPVRWLLLKNKILKAYSKTDLVIDEAGISFVDSRGPIMNTYAFVCMAVPLLMGTPVVKYSQALGTFRNPLNRLLAKWILPKLKLICARGEVTRKNLQDIGITKNVSLCADGAFSMPDSPSLAEKVAGRCAEDPFFADDGKIIGLSVSSVVDKKCAKQNIDYRKITVECVDRLTRQGWRVLIIANAARLGSEKTRNNDLMVGDAVYAAVSDPSQVRWYHEEMEPEEIREYIARCRFLIASRFHAMIGALYKQVPVLLIGWSHKYQEVLDMFGLGSYAVDFSKLSTDDILARFDELQRDEDGVREKLRTHLPQVKKLSAKNMELICPILDSRVASDWKKNRIFDLNRPDDYLGEHLACRKGFALHEEDRERASSGGVITSILVDSLRSGAIDGAWVTKAVIENGKPEARTFIATTEEEIRDCGTSVYMSFPQLSHLDLLENFNGKVAVVMVPCMLRALDGILQKRTELRDKVALRIGLYCSGNHSPEATSLSIRKAGLSLEGAKRLYYRRGHWRGQSAIAYQDGHEVPFSYTKLLCAYKNAYFFENRSCMSCRDHFAVASDLSMGDIWLKEMKKNPIKHSSCVIRTQRGMDAVRHAEESGMLHTEYISDADMLRSQKRALVFKFDHDGAHSHWNHRLAYFLAEKDRKFSYEHPDRLERIPSILIYYYMCFIRVLLSF